MTSDRITANLPSRNFDVTEKFYRTLGFRTAHRDDNWMILKFEGMEVEFFAHPRLDPLDSWFSACMRRDDIDGTLAAWQATGIATDGNALPRVSAKPFEMGGDVPRMFVLHDPDGSLWRVLENGDDG